MNSIKPVSAKITIVLITIIALCWLVFGILVVTNSIPTIPSGLYSTLLGMGTIVCSLIIALAAFFLSRRNRIVYYMSVALLGTILVVSFMDDLGWLDFTLIGITAITFILLIRDHRWYLNRDG